MSSCAVTVFGADRPGIVAAVTRVLTHEGCNLEDTAMTILRGHFAMMLVVEAPSGGSAEGLQAALARVADPLGLAVSVRPVVPVPIDPALVETGVPAPILETWTVAVHGADRVGIVSRFSAVLAAVSANIIDLSTRVIGDASQPAYVMILEVTLPAGVEVQELRQALDAAALALGVSCSLHPSEADIL